MSKDNSNNSKMGISTLLCHLGEGDNPLGAHLQPIYQTSTFTFETAQEAADVFAGKQKGYAYTRSGGPNFDHLATKIACLEGLDIEAPTLGKVTSSGMAATAAAIMGRVSSGDTIITQSEIYGNSYKFFNEMAPRLGLKIVWTEGLSIAEWKAAFEKAPEAKLFFCETPANPTMNLIDLQALAELAHLGDAWVMVDNTFATPYLQRPLSLGCDVVIHSTTKYLSGHGQVIGGAIVSHHQDYMKKDVALTHKMFGVTPSPFDAWLINIGLKTLELRMKAHCQNAETIADWLNNHEMVEKVYYPGLTSHPDHELAKKQMPTGYGGMISFDIKGGRTSGETFVNHVKLISLAVSLGNVDTLVQHPASMTHAPLDDAALKKAKITQGLIRLSIGIENVEDLIADISQALDSI
ncbi:MAG: PLP-dependent transferase [Pseudomonadales bacterium]|nr:PLP-dependent transferase [Pseudomonadales bacterium]